MVIVIDIDIGEYIWVYIILQTWCSHRYWKGCSLSNIYGVAMIIDIVIVMVTVDVIIDQL